MRFQITKGKVKSAIRLVCYGPEGIGKSTFASKFPDPLFIDTEDGTKQLDIARFPKPETWGDLLEMVDAVIAEPETCQTLVLDTLDRAEAMLIRHLCETARVDSIEKYGGGYGKGYTATAEYMEKDLLRRLDRLITKGVNVVILSHAMMRKFESPTDPPYDRWELKVSKKVAPLIREWSDIMLFMNYEVMVVEENGKGKARGKGRRMMYANHHATYDAKNRYGLPDEMELSFKPLKKIYEGTVPPREDKTQLNIDHPDDGIVEDEMLEDPRLVLVRRLAEKGITQERLEQWMIASGRLEEGGSVMNLSGTQADTMTKHIDQLARVIGGKE